MHWMNFVEPPTWGDSRLPDYFWSHVQPCPMSGCWHWTGATQGNGYATTKWRRRTALAHRISFGILRDSLYPDMHLDHLCRNRSCVNPDHLEQVTPRENTVRGLAPEAARRRHASVTHCPRGHEYTKENTKTRLGRGYVERECRTCRRAEGRVYAARKRAERNGI
jgi:hypothetical protein